VPRSSARGHDRVLSEGGPSALGSLLGAGCLGELFLTISPLLAGRDQGHGNRLGLVERMELLPDRRLDTSLLGVRRDGAYLFLRYAVAAGV
jgi:riboflavin biosynthesis pyrimidine reductase